jgi:hypothetical protein
MYMIMMASLSLLGALSALVGLQTPTVSPFPDVPPGHWAYQAVTDLHNRGILLGYPGRKVSTDTARESVFSPAKNSAKDGTIKRSSASKISRTAFQQRRSEKRKAPHAAKH